jgi:uncharacterized membrane protein YphA (DoxX/SURF4 family)
MSGRMSGRQQPNLLLGVLRLARFDAAGLAEFGETTQAFLASLAPLIAFPLVGAGLMLLRGGGLDAVAGFLATLCALLTPPVLSQLLALLWRREPEWLRYATAFNWCQWVIPVAAAVVLLLGALLVAMGLPHRVGALVVVLGLLSYGLALHWFIARNGLRLSAVRATILVVVVNFGTALLVLAPGLLTIDAKEG